MGICGVLWRVAADDLEDDCFAGDKRRVPRCAAADGLEERHGYIGGGDVAWMKRDCDTTAAMPGRLTSRGDPSPRPASPTPAYPSVVRMACRPCRPRSEGKETCRRRTSSSEERTTKVVKD
ncbi:hypothetical protein BV20DRAFT_547520 [Pilatotrama ljubarskyi]|nr:hypothetical protein BV20DRAFT_547520 [Pilatotrama ljubarskyi]